jgi:uncharacterized integral membrane protein (TIGR00698 family)
MDTSLSSPAIVPPRSAVQRALTVASEYLPGLALAGLIAAVSMQLGKFAWLLNHGISVLTVAIVLGMIVGNTVFPHIAQASAPGIVFSKQRLLRLGIVLYGFRLTFQDIGQVGVGGVVIDTLMVSGTFGLAWLLGTRVFGLDRKTAMLIGTGSAICGAAAVMAAQSVVRGKPEQVTIAISTVVVFGTLAIFLYPALYQLNLQWHLLPLGGEVAGLYIGSSVHEVAQVAAAGSSISSDIANTAVITKMVRVMMLAPFLIALSAYLSREAGRGEEGEGGSVSAAKQGIVIPWFALGFVAMAGLNSLKIFSPAVVSAVNTFDNIPLAMAMGALGLTTHVSAIRTAGKKPMLLATALFAWLVVGGLMITLAVTALIK